MSSSVWGKDDCLTAVLGDDWTGDRRPDWLRTPDAVKALANFKREYGRDLKAAAIAFGAQFGKGYELLDGIDYKRGDVVVGKTREHEFVIAKVGASCHPYIRTEIGYDVARFTEIFAVWRPL